MNDGVLELWLRLASLHFDDACDKDSEAHQIREQWLLASQGYFSGCVPDGLEEAVSTTEGRDAVISCVDSLKNSLKKAPDFLDKDFLNLLGSEGEFLSDFETARLIEVSDAILGLVNGTVGSTDASDTSFMPGSIRNA